MAMSGGGGGGRKVMADINVTPLVDVMLVLLIIFMVATPLIKDDEQREVDVSLPVTRNNPNTVDINDSDKFILRIDRNLVVTVGDETITDCSTVQAGELAQRWERCFDEIQDKLGANHRLEEDESLYLYADAEIPYGFVVGAMNRIRLAGVSNIGMITNPEYLPTEQ